MKVTSIGLMAALAVSVGCHKTPPIDNKALKDFEVVNLVANKYEYHPKYVDPTLINGFGIAWSPGGIAWVNSVGGHVSNLYDSGGIFLTAVQIPTPKDSTGGFPCGVVFSNNLGFKLPNGRSSIFLFSSFDGVISGWNAQALLKAPRVKAPAGASYTGLAIGNSNGSNLIYAANFGQKKIDVWDTNFHKFNLPFYDPAMPAAYSPYNIQAVGNYLFVIYAELQTSGPNKGHGVAGAGKGFVDVYGMDGKLVNRFASHGALNLPWGVTAAPAGFLKGKELYGGEGYVSKNYGGGGGGGSQGGDDIQGPVVLVGNFGDGRINVFTEEGKFLGQLQSRHKVLEIEGLWALTFPPASTMIDPGFLYFSAGPNNETDGVFGYIRKQ